ncbi:serine/threonine-protein kinase ULK3-like [Branchiostoma floridae x Branchiostoma belcheri]
MSRPGTARPGSARLGSARLAAVPQLPDFVLTERLGSGTYATVFKAYSKSKRRQVVAIKCIQKSNLNKAATDNLLTEIEILKNVRHPHIVELKDFQWDRNNIYLIMEYCSGGDLSRFIHSKRTLPEYLAKRFGQQLAMALQFLRSKNISHMDLKPQNILLSSRDNPVLKLADFGFAQYMGDEARMTSLRGSPLYMAPEMFCNTKYDARVDLWSLGVILYEALFGRAPFYSRSYAELEVKIRDTRPVEIPQGIQISGKCRDLLLGLLQRDPNQRITFEEFFNHPFIDLEHVPSHDSLDKAVAIVTEAVKYDEEGSHAEAVKKYCDALEYFVPAVHYETDESKKDVLRKRVMEYMARAEELKSMIKPPDEEEPTNEDGEDDEREATPKEAETLWEMAGSCTRLHQALKRAAIAELRAEHELYDSALEEYKHALEELLSLLEAEPKGRRRDLLHMEVEKLLNHAQAVKDYKNMMKRDAPRLSDSGERYNDSRDDMNRCVVQ